MTVKITPKKLTGRIEAVSSKSDAHRLMICAALADAGTHIMLNAVSEDIIATARCLRALGAGIEQKENGFFITPIKKRQEIPILDCGESGSTLRFLIPVACAIYDECHFHGSGRLMQRPLSPLLDALAEHGVISEMQGQNLALKGRLTSGRFNVSGSISSQYISGLLFALPLLGNESEIVLSSVLQSSGYVDMTLDSMNAFGVKIERQNGSFVYRSGQRYLSPATFKVQGDWSNAAFWFGVGALGGDITVTGTDIKSLQRDRKIIRLCESFGANITHGAEGYRICSGRLRPIGINAENIPDLVPVLAVIASGAKGKTEIHGISRLRLKESDRVLSVTSLINSLGGCASADADTMCINGNGCLRGGEVNGFNDHRIVMAAAVASVICDHPVIINDAQAVGKSYPRFFEDFNRLGGVADVV